MAKIIEFPKPEGYIERRKRPVKTRTIPPKRGMVRPWKPRMTDEMGRLKAEFMRPIIEDWKRAKRH
jgi:hypothetical protein